MKFYSVALKDDILFLESGPEVKEKVKEKFSKDGKTCIKVEGDSYHYIITEKYRHLIRSPNVSLCFSYCDRYVLGYSGGMVKIFDVEFGECLYSTIVQFIIIGEIDLNREISGEWTLLKLSHVLPLENSLLDSTLFSTIDEFAN